MRVRLVPPGAGPLLERIHGAGRLVGAEASTAPSAGAHGMGSPLAELHDCGAAPSSWPLPFHSPSPCSLRFCAGSGCARVGELGARCGTGETPSAGCAAARWRAGSKVSEEESGPRKLPGGSVASRVGIHLYIRTDRCFPNSEGKSPILAQAATRGGHSPATGQPVRIAL